MYQKRKKQEQKKTKAHFKDLINRPIDSNCNKNTISFLVKNQQTYLKLIFPVLVCSLDGADEVTVMEGDSVTLNTGVTEVQNYYLIQWMFGETRIAEINRFSQSSTIYNTDDDKTLRDRLKLDPQTGSLTITNTRSTDSGRYQLILTSDETRSKSFRVTVSGE